MKHYAPAVVGSRWQDRDTRAGVRIVEVVDVEPGNRYVIVRRIAQDGTPLTGQLGRRLRILIAGLWSRYDHLPGNVAAIAPVPDDVEHLIVGLVAPRLEAASRQGAVSALRVAAVCLPAPAEKPTFTHAEVVDYLNSTAEGIEQAKALTP